MIFARAFTVFIVEQVDGYDCKPAPQLDQAARFTQADAFVANLGIPCEYGGDVVCYNVATDTVHMPHFAQIKDAASHAGTLIHESGHAQERSTVSTATSAAASVPPVTPPKKSASRF
jgi:antirestriction protein ArdC